MDAVSKDSKDCLATLMVEKDFIHISESLALAPARPTPIPTQCSQLGERRATAAPAINKQSTFTAASLEAWIDNNDELTLNIPMAEIVHAITN